MRWLSKKRNESTALQLQDHNFNMNQYAAFVQKLVSDLVEGKWTILKFVAFPDGTFGLNTTLAATGSEQKHHFEILEQGQAACPHCLVLWTLKNIAAGFNFDQKSLVFSTGEYVRLLGTLKLPELYVMHKQTLQGQGGRAMRPHVVGDWLADCVMAEQQLDRMPFTGGCPTHEYQGR